MRNLVTDYIDERSISSEESRSGEGETSLGVKGARANASVRALLLFAAFDQVEDSHSPFHRLREEKKVTQLS